MVFRNVPKCQIFCKWSRLSICHLSKLSAFGINYLFALCISMLPRGYRTESELRKRQIDTLKIFNDNVTELEEGSEYSVKFESDGNELTLKVFLNSSFPTDRPKLYISPLIVHSWVNSDGEVTDAPGLLNYTVHSDLGRIVQAIISEWIRNPPPIASEVASGVSRIDQNAQPKGLDMERLGRISPVSNSYNNYLPSAIGTLGSVSSNSVFSQSVCFPELNSMTLAELKNLNESEDRQDDFIASVPTIAEADRGIDELISQIEELANSNLSRRKQLENLRSEVICKIEKVNALRNKCEILNQNYHKLSEKYSPHNIKDLLRQAAAELDDESERIAENFIHGLIDADKFLDEYLKLRKLSQIRKTKEEKLAHQLNELKRAGF